MEKRNGTAETQSSKRKTDGESGRAGEREITPSPPHRLMDICVLCVFAVSVLFPLSFVFAKTDGPTAKFTIARLKYSGGGDWYNDPSVIPNLLDFLREHTAMEVASEEVSVAISDEDFFSYPLIYMTGHGNVSFSEEEARRLRVYLEHGGFLYADDDYGMDRAFRREIKKVFPDKELLEVPLSHGIFHSPFEFPQGLPKIHQHDGGPPQAFGIFHEKRLIVLYTFETNISDGWASPQVHHDPREIREAALKMGTNIVVWAVTH
jgi:hypothetical protein